MDVNIYGLIDPCDEIVRYVGKTKNSLHRRLTDHLWEAKSNRPGYKNHWIRTLLAQGLAPKIIILEICNETNWEEREKHHIKIRSDLCNMTEGGDGCTAPREVMERVWASNRGRVRSDETRKRQSEAMKGKPKSPEHTAKVSAALTGKSFPHLRGQQNKSSKLTEDKVRGIRLLSASGISNKDLAVMFSVTPANIWLIVTNRAWKHI